jgi:hypothetical protein
MTFLSKNGRNFVYNLLIKLIMVERSLHFVRKCVYGDILYEFGTIYVQTIKYVCRVCVWDCNWGIFYMRNSLDRVESVFYSLFFYPFRCWIVTLNKLLLACVTPPW